MTQDVRDLIAEAREAMTERDDTGWTEAVAVPVEPNDDRERLARLLAAQDGEEWDRLVGTAEYARNRYLRKAGAILDRMPSLSRAAVPDAATELRAERDAALAAVERVRAVHANAGPSQGYDSRFKGGYGMLGDCCAACGSHGEYGVEWPCPTIAALDGAPEPGERL